ncbi:MAG: hypothetical protein GYA57_13715, partial [Myxococcales bacterium]|nr:hypothetical protein [Myxococcales bacterium]
MRGRWKFAGVLVLLFAVDCRTPPPAPVEPLEGGGAAATEPAGPAATEPRGPAAAAARAPLPQVEWGEPETKYAACPKELCARLADVSTVRGCEADAADLAPPPAPPVA